jgi:xylose isomerase
MAGLNFYHVVAQALEAGKLFHIDLNDQKPGRFDQDLRFGSESIKPLFFLVKLLEESGYDGPRHFDAHAYRTEDAEGVWGFARGCMRTYLILKEKAKQFCADKEIQALLAEIRGDGSPPEGGHYDGEGSSRPEVDEDARSVRLQADIGAYTRGRAEQIKAQSFDRQALALRRLPYEKLDQLVVDLLLGAR